MLFLDWMFVELLIQVLIMLLLEINAKEFLIPRTVTFQPTKMWWLSPACMILKEEDWLESSYYSQIRQEKSARAVLSEP